MIKRFLLPIVIVIAGFGLAAVIVSTGPKMEPQAAPSSVPLVRTWEASARAVQMTTITHGTVLPRTESDLIPEVSGRVTGISPAMVSGGFFSKGDMLLEIDPLDYEVALEQARAALASAQSEFTNAKRAYERQQNLARKQSTSESLRDDALNRFYFAQASIREAKARLSRARRDLVRTKVKAPYDGRVRSERVDVGQFVNRGASIASLYSTDFAEVRLPVHDEELAYLKLPLAGVADDNALKPKVTLRAKFAGKEHVWEGIIVRTEGELDPQTRMINVIAQVEAPYEQKDDRPPLAVGLFVEAEILGNQVDSVYIVPRSALQANNQVYIIDGENRLVFREVDILRIIDEKVYIRGGFASGETVCLSTLNNAVQGMVVQPVSQPGVAAS
tara:strand:+ start:7262 stop:8425 length:1164 start_codon:yes stop_codon:yes gene_type:complete